MKKSTIETIYALKQGEGSYDERVAKYWSEHTGVPVEYYKRAELTDIARMVFLDYLETADNPKFEVWHLFDCMPFDYKYHMVKLYNPEDGFDDKIRHSIWVTLALTEVCNNGQYVNGFREIEPRKDNNNAD